MTLHQVLRRTYLDRLDMFRDKTHIVKVITGVRRCGKSTLLDQYITKLIAEGVPESSIFRVNLESAEYYQIKKYHDLTEYLYSRIPAEEKCYIFLDEIQRVEEWERSVNALLVDRNADIYVTGSNSHLLSSELSTFLTGRYTTIKMLPLSFAEFCELHSDSGMDNTRLFWLFLTYGGFPGVDPLEGDTHTRSNLQDMYSSIILWDIIARSEIRNTEELNRLMHYMMINVGNPTSVRSIVNGMGDIHRETVEKYLALAEQAFVLYRADRFDLKNNALQPAPKYYAVDQGLRNMALGFDLSGIGCILENMVYLELIRRGYHVTIGKWNAKEIDFTASLSDGKKEYIQVCYDINADTKEREIAPLRNISDSFPKMVLTMNPPISYVTDEGIIVKNIIEWLLESDKSI